MNKPMASQEHLDLEEVLRVGRAPAPAWWRRRSVRWTSAIAASLLAVIGWALSGSRSAIQ